MAKNEDVKKMLEAVGAMAEMGLTFYRAAIGAGATAEEATRLMQAYYAAQIYGKGRPPEQKD